MKKTLSIIALAVFLSTTVDFANAKELSSTDAGQHACYGLTPDQLGRYLAYRCSDCIQYRANEYRVGSESTCPK